MMMYIEQQLHAVQATNRAVAVQQQHLAGSDATHSLTAGVPSCNNNRQLLRAVNINSYHAATTAKALVLRCCYTTATVTVLWC